MRRVLRALPVIALAVAGACVHVKVDHPAASATAIADVTAQISAMMTRSAASWNRGDLDAFLNDYEDDATFVARTSVIHGRDRIRGVYAARFAPGGVRDSLSFENIEVDPLGADVAHTIAWYRLSRGDSTIARGPTSLLMRRTDGRWRIVHDHSS